MTAFLRLCSLVVAGRALLLVALLHGRFPRLHAFLARVLTRPWHRLLRSAGTLRLILVTSLAAGAGWQVADLLGLLSPVVCAIAATLTVQATIHSSFKEGAYRIVATVAGMLIAVMTFHHFGISSLSVVFVVGVSLVVGRALRLGAEGSLQVPVTSLFLFVLGTSLTDDLMLDRMMANLLGVALGVCFSLFAHPSTPLENASGKLELLSLEIAKQLSVLASGASRPYTRSEAAAWLSDSRRLSGLLSEATAAVESAVLHARWSLGASSDEVSPLLKTVQVLSHSSDQVNSIARTLFDAAAADSSTVLPEGVTAALGMTGEAFALHAEALSADPAAAPGVLEDVLDEVREVRERSLTNLRSIDDTGAWLLSGSILTDIDRMVDELDHSAPALDLDAPGTRSVLPVVREALADLPLPLQRKLWEGRRSQ